MSKPKSLLRLVLTAVLAGVLAACASTTPTPPEPDWVLEVEGKLAPEQYDPGAVFWTQTLVDFSDDWVASYDWYEPSFPVAADGSYEISLDARDFPGDPLTPQEFGTRHLFPLGTDEVEVNVSNPNAELRVIISNSLFQISPEQGGLVHSHWLFHTQSVQSGDITYSYSGTLVFSDVAVSIDGTANAPGLDPHRAVALDLEPGWNLVHATPVETPGLLTYESHPLDSQPTLLSRAARSLGSRASSPPASELGGYSVFAGHLVSQDAVPADMYSVSLSNSTSTLRAYSWYGSTNDPESFLVTFPEALGFGDAATGSHILADPDTRAATAIFHYYDEFAVDEALWWQDPDKSTGFIEMESAGGNSVGAIYVDRDTTLELLDYEIEGHTITANDVELYFGWNLLEAIEVDATTTEIVRYVSDTMPSWELVPKGP